MYVSDISSVHFGHEKLQSLADDEANDVVADWFVAGLNQRFKFKAMDEGIDFECNIFFFNFLQRVF